MNSDTIDNVDKDVDEKSLASAIAWWEKKRLWFNFIVGLSGLLPMVMAASELNRDDFIGIILYAVMMNIFYSVGFLIEALDQYYLNQKIKIYKIRLVLFVLGTVASCLVTFVSTFLYFAHILC